MLTTDERAELDRLRALTNVLTGDDWEHTIPWLLALVERQAAREADLCALVRAIDQGESVYATDPRYTLTDAQRALLRTAYH